MCQGLASSELQLPFRRVSESPTPAGLEESAAVHLQFVRQHAPHLYRCASLLLSMKKGKPNSTPPICTAVRLPFLRQYASHLYGSTFEKVLGAGVNGKFLNHICHFTPDSSHRNPCSLTVSCCCLRVKVSARCCHPWGLCQAHNHHLPIHMTNCGHARVPLCTGEDRNTQRRAPRSRALLPERKSVAIPRSGGHLHLMEFSLPMTLKQGLSSIARTLKPLLGSFSFAPVKEKRLLLHHEGCFL